MLDGFRHEALPYSGHDDFTVAVRDLVRDGLDRDDRLIVLADSAKVVDVSDALGTDAREVTFVALDEHGRNPSRVTTLLNSFRTANDDRQLLGISETVVPGRSADALSEAQLTEFLLNDDAVAGWPLTLVCAYDTTELPDDAVEVMRQSHAVVRGLDSNPDFRPGYAGDLMARPLEPPPSAAEHLDVAAPDLMRLREIVHDHAVRCALEADRVDDLVLAVNEVATNSVLHGGGRARVVLWPGARGAVCEVRDAGRITDPFVGRFVPSPTATRGRGLWLVNHLCDLVQLRSSEAGTTVRLYVDRRHP